MKQKTLIIYIVGLLCLLGFSSNGAPLKSYELRDGFIDLSDLSPDEVVRLDGDWEFYWNKLYFPQDFRQPTDELKKFRALMNVPSLWNDVESPREPFPGKGHATYRLLVNLEPGDNLLGLKLLDAATAYRLWVNDLLLSENGIVSDDPATAHPQYLPRTVFFKPQDYYGRTGNTMTIQIVVQVSNYHHKKGGLWESISLGSENAVKEKREQNIILNFLALGIIIIMSLYHLGLFFQRRKEYSALFFSIMSFLMAIRSVVMGERMMAAWFPSINWEFYSKMEYLSSYEMVLFITIFFYSIFPAEIKKRAVTLIIAVGSCIALIIIIFPLWIYCEFKIFFDLYILLGGLYILFVLSLAAIRRRQGALIALFGMIVLYGTGVNDILYNSQVIRSMNLAPFGLMIYILSQSYLLARRFSNAFVTVETLSGQLHDKNLELLSMDRLKDEFLANTSHELRTPLNGIIGIVESIMDGAAGAINERLKYNLSLVSSSAKRLANLVNDILDFSKMKNSILDLQIQTVDLYSLADHVLMLTKPLAGNKGLSLLNTISYDLPPVRGDENRLQQILYNLIGNAIKFTLSGKVEISAYEIKNGSFLEVAVADTGIGITPEQHERIFNSFEQGDGSVSRDFGGTGLGLAISKKLIELHGGEIRLESRAGRGSTFFFTLPVALDHKNNVKRAITRIEHHLEALDTEIEPERLFDPETENPIFRIMAVDDDPINLQVLKNHLNSMNYHIVEAHNGMEALELIETQEKPDLVLLDIMMPRLSGYDVCREIRKKYNHNDLPVVMLTAKRLINDLIQGFDAGANDYLVKPFDKRELLARVQTLLRLKQATQEHSHLLLMEKELDIAGKVQKDVLTDEKFIEDIQGYDISITYLPYNGKVGGDYYNVEILDNGILSIMLADATGHGLQAALSTMQIDIMNNQSLNLVDPDKRLFYLNNFCIKNLRSRNVFTAFLLNIDNNRVFYSSAGHPDQYLIRYETGEIVVLQAQGRIIGFIPDALFPMESATIEKNDIIILFSDGLIEEYNKEGTEFGTEGLTGLLQILVEKNYHRRELNFFHRQIIEEVQRYMGKEGLSDDLTLLTLQKKP